MRTTTATKMCIGSSLARGHSTSVCGACQSPAIQAVIPTAKNRIAMTRGEIIENTPRSRLRLA